MARLPTPGSDNGTWGGILNDFLSQAHKADGTLKDNVVTSNVIAPNSVTKADVGLGNVDNTSDINKPMSTAQQAAIDVKYTKPVAGIPKTDLAASLQTSLDKADTAYQAPVVVAAGVDQATARSAINAVGSAKVTKNIAGTGAVVLTQAECGVVLLELAGATQALTITIPTGQSFTLTNSTDYTQSIKRSGSSKSIALDSGGNMEVQS